VIAPNPISGYEKCEMKSPGLDLDSAEVVLGGRRHADCKMRERIVTLRTTACPKRPHTRAPILLLAPLQSVNLTGRQGTVRRVPTQRVERLEKGLAFGRPSPFLPFLSLFGSRVRELRKIAASRQVLQSRRSAKRPNPRCMTRVSTGTSNQR
jgi:hypothetical protein